MSELPLCTYLKSETPAYPEQARFGTFKFKSQWQAKKPETSSAEQTVKISKTSNTETLPLTNKQQTNKDANYTILTSLLVQASLHISSPLPGRQNPQT